MSQEAGEPRRENSRGYRIRFPWVSPILVCTLNNQIRDFPDGTVVKNPPANAGDTGSSSGPGRSHVPQSS